MKLTAAVLALVEAPEVVSVLFETNPRTDQAPK